MKLYGSLSRLVAILFRKDSQDLTLRPNQATTYTAARDFQLPPGDAAHVLMSASSTATMTNKTFDADGSGNSISNIENADIKSGAAIDAAKIHNGSVSNTEFGYLDGVTSGIQGQFDGLRWKKPVRAASTANVVIASELENGDSLDGVTLATGDRVLLKDQSTGAQNGIYIVAASGAASRALDADASSEFPGLYVHVHEGTANADTLWACSNNENFVLDTDTPAFSRQYFVTSATAGSALTYTAGVLDVGVDNSTIEVSSDALRVKDAGITNAKVATGIDAAKLADGSVSNTEFQYINSLTSNAQTQIDGKVSDTGDTMTGNLIMDNEKEVRFREATGGGTNYVGLKAPAALAGDLTYTLPNAAPASNGYVLASQTDGTMSWVSNASTSSSKTTWLAADGATKSITHSLGTTDVMVQVFDIANGQTIEMDIVQRTDANTVDLTASEAPGVSWRVLILAV